MEELVRAAILGVVQGLTEFLPISSSAHLILVPKFLGWTDPFLDSAAFDVGSDTRTPVDDADYQVPFRFTGKINKVQVKLGPSQLMPEDQKAAREMRNNANK